MFAGFNLEIKDEYLLFKQSGKLVFDKYQEEVERILDSYLLDDGSIDGTKMQNEWFPELTADVFISHSHSDKEYALALAGWLKEKMGLNAFIDSCVWGYADDLLKKIDDKYCLNSSGNTYNYELRNYSTSHVHTMLSMALTKMIDKTECIIFLNTPKSIETHDVIQKTKSPWIYHEIGMTKLLEKKKPRRHDLIKKGFNFENAAQDLIIKYNLDLNHLIPIYSLDLKEWETVKKDVPLHALDILYSKFKLLEFNSTINN